jgi:hypothetical protein
MGTLGIPIGCPAGRGHGWPALPVARCKGRGVCPSCNGRHMAQTAAHLADHVIPPVPVRQWVISVPKRRRSRYRLRGFLADRPRAVAALASTICSGRKEPFGRERPGADRETEARDSRAAHQSGDACGSAIGRAILCGEA